MSGKEIMAPESKQNLLPLHDVGKGFMSYLSIALYQPVEVYLRENDFLSQPGS
jgi:hypothetical protein